MLNIKQHFIELSNPFGQILIVLNLEAFCDLTIQFVKFVRFGSDNYYYF